MVRNLTNMHQALKEAPAVPDEEEGGEMAKHLTSIRQHFEEHLQEIKKYISEQAMAKLIASEQAVTLHLEAAKKHEAELSKWKGSMTSGSTFQEIFTQFTSSGIQAAMKDGVLTFNHLQKVVT